MRLYGDIDLCQHWLTYWFVAWRYHAITWTNVDVSSKVFCGIHLREISHEIPMEPIRNMCSNITLWKLLPHTPWAKWVNTLRPRQSGRHFADAIFKCNCLNGNIWIPIKMSLTFVPKGPINNIPALVQVMAWRRPGAKQLSEPMMVNLPSHICVTRPQWVKE